MTKLTFTAPRVVSFADVAACNKAKRQPSTKCRKCERATAEAKDYCVDHITERPYVAALLERNKVYDKAIENELAILRSNFRYTRENQKTKKKIGVNAEGKTIWEESIISVEVAKPLPMTPARILPLTSWLLEDMLSFLRCGWSVGNVARCIDVALVEALRLMKMLQHHGCTFQDRGDGSKSVWFLESEP